MYAMVDPGIKIGQLLLLSHNLWNLFSILLRRKFVFIAGVDPATQRCTAGQVGGPSPCHGDGGSPVYTVDKLDPDRIICLYGLLSYFDSECNGTAVYTKLAPYFDWIKTIVQDAELYTTTTPPTTSSTTSSTSSSTSISTSNSITSSTSSSITSSTSTSTSSSTPSSTISSTTSFSSTISSTSTSTSIGTTSSTTNLKTTGTREIRETSQAVTNPQEYGATQIQNVSGIGSTLTVAEYDEKRSGQKASVSDVGNGKLNFSLTPTVPTTIQQEKHPGEILPTPRDSQILNPINIIDGVDNRNLDELEPSLVESSNLSEKTASRDKSSAVRKFLNLPYFFILMVNIVRKFYLEKFNKVKA